MILKLKFFLTAVLVSACLSAVAQEGAIVTSAATENVPDVIGADQIHLLTQRPEFVGGMAAFYQYIGNNFIQPDQEISGRIIMEFIVETDGSLSNIKVVQDVGCGTGAEATRLLANCPKWKPGKIGDTPVRALFTLPIRITSE